MSSEREEFLIMVMKWLAERPNSIVMVMAETGGCMETISSINSYAWQKGAVLATLDSINTLYSDNAGTKEQRDAYRAQFGEYLASQKQNKETKN